MVVVIVIVNSTSSYNMYTIVIVIVCICSGTCERFEGIVELFRDIELSMAC